MISRRAKIFAATTMSALVLASPALAGGWWGPRYGGWGYGRGGYGPGWGAAAAVGALGGLAVGLIASQAAAYPTPYYYGPRCRVVSQPVFDPYGYVAGYRPVQVCD